MPQTFAILFPGQGSQEQGMGRDLAEHWSDAMELWKLAEKESGVPLREIFWDGDEESMSQTRHLQPAMTVVNMAAWLFLRHRHQAACVAGHSLGEFVALFAAGVLDHTEILQTVSLRGRLMAEAGQQAPGTMLAVLKLGLEQVEKIVSDIRGQSQQELRIANYNTPNQYVLSGENEAIARVVPLVKEHRGFAIPLPVSGAFHSPLMKEAADELGRFMESLTWKSPRIPIVFNVTARTKDKPESIQRLMQQQMTSSVLWEQGIRYMKEIGVHTYIEIGPKGILGRMIKTILADQEHECRSLSTLEQLTQWNALQDKDYNA